MAVRVSPTFILMTFFALFNIASVWSVPISPRATLGPLGGHASPNQSTIPSRRDYEGYQKRQEPATSTTTPLIVTITHSSPIPVPTAEDPEASDLPGLPPSESDSVSTPATATPTGDETATPPVITNDPTSVVIIGTDQVVTVTITSTIVLVANTACTPAPVPEPSSLPSGVATDSNGSFTLDATLTISGSGTVTGALPTATPTATGEATSTTKPDISVNGFSTVRPEPTVANNSGDNTTDLSFLLTATVAA
ncbi:hypothetical protein AX16_006728 [Volvariella volvacea WC 439]|nr:hypothetical protein AX16_006728 [Volvariella volvacea WC 439]